MKRGCIYSHLRTGRCRSVICGVVTSDAMPAGSVNYRGEFLNSLVFFLWRLGS